MGKFKVGDKVRIIKGDAKGKESEIMTYDLHEAWVCNMCKLKDYDWWFREDDLELVESLPEPVDQEYLSKLSMECTVLMTKNQDLEKEVTNLRKLNKQLIQDMDDVCARNKELIELRGETIEKNKTLRILYEKYRRKHYKHKKRARRYKKAIEERNCIIVNIARKDDGAIPNRPK